VSGWPSVTSAMATLRDGSAEATARAYSMTPVSAGVIGV
jgi:hypothetical protein